MFVNAFLSSVMNSWNCLIKLCVFMNFYGLRERTPALTQIYLNYSDFQLLYFPTPNLKIMKPMLAEKKELHYVM